MVSSVTDISDYFSMEQRILELESENEKLTKINLNLYKNNSKWKMKYKKLCKPTRKETRTKQATIEVQNWIDGKSNKTFRKIAEECFLSRETIKNISYRLRHKND